MELETGYLAGFDARCLAVGLLHKEALNVMPQQPRVPVKATARRSNAEAPPREDNVSPKKARATPAKDFFIGMITKDITLQDCILDLLDNSIDGALRQGLNAHAIATPFAGLGVSLDFEPERFIISDNCGGITLGDALDYAFHFGRRRSTSREPEHAIGLYGIGMKRAIFKIGNHASIQSKTTEDSFTVAIDVPVWAQTEDWDFDLGEGCDLETPGTTIQIDKLHSEVSAAFGDKVFTAEMVKTVERDYAVFLRKGLTVTINGDHAHPWIPSFRTSKEFHPAKEIYSDDGIEIELVAGMAAFPPDDDSAEARIPAREQWGWYIACNDRVVLAADKTAATVWGDEDFPHWHNQYNGFLGIATFRCADPSRLPWTTTKRAVDVTSAVYRRTIVKMKKLTRLFLDYTTARKGDLKGARRLEGATREQPLTAIEPNATMRLPNVRRIAMINVQYQRPKSDIHRAAQALGEPGMSGSEVGRRTFEYFMAKEVED